MKKFVAWLSVFFAGMAAEKFINKSKYDCGKLYLYTVVLYMSIAALGLVSLMFMASAGNRYVSTTSIGIALLIYCPFYIIWNILGLYWLLKSYFLTGICLNRLEIVLLVFIEVKVTSIFCLLLAACTYLVCYKRVMNRRGNAAERKKHTNIRIIYKKLLLDDVNLTAREVELCRNGTAVRDYIKSVPFDLNEMKVFDKHYKLSDAAGWNSYLDKDDKSCIICLEELTPDDTVFYLTCSHIFHYTCAQDWIITKPECPTCKKDIRWSIFEILYNKL